MRDRHRPALQDLTAEKRNHGTGRTHHIAEPYGHKPRAVALLALHNQFRHTLAGTHHVGRSNGFIRRNHDKTLHMMFNGHFHYHTAADNVIEDSLPGIFFHHGDMFICRRVKYSLGFVLFKNVIY